MRCLQCQHENQESRRFCAECGSPLDFACSVCAFVNEPGDKFCGGCGKSLTPPTPVPSMLQEAEAKSRFYAVLPLIISLLQRERRLPYQTLTDAFDLDNALLGKICEDLSLRRLATDEADKVLIWTGAGADPVYTTTPSALSPDAPVEATVAPSASIPVPEPQVVPTVTETHGSTAFLENSVTDITSGESVVAPDRVRSALEAERRQLTVMFCDLVGSTDLSGKLDPEDLREVVRAYQETAAEVIQRYEGHIAQYLGDGLLIYFGYPVAHENDAQRAVYTGLGIPKAMATLNSRLEAGYGVQLAVRIGIHTRPVVVGEMGGGGRHENLALGETPNIAARLEGLAPANTAVISPVTAQLVQRSFVLEEFGPHGLKGVTEPMMLYTVVSPREVEPDEHEDMLAGGFDALVGRNEEIGLLRRRWEQSKEGVGQAVLISGEPGIGKSSLVATIRRHVVDAGYTRITFRSSPYHTSSALYPVITHLEQMLGFDRDDTSGTKLDKLEQALRTTSLPLEESVPLVATLLSVPLKDRYPALAVSPHQQRQQTLDTLVAWLMEEAERQPTLAVWEDLHWSDPSTLEMLGLVLEQTPTVPMLNVLTFRPEFTPPWSTRSHMTGSTEQRYKKFHRIC